MLTTDPREVMEAIMADVDRMVKAREKKLKADPLWSFGSHWAQEEREARDRIEKRVSELFAQIHPYRG